MAKKTAKAKFEDYTARLDALSPVIHRSIPNVTASTFEAILAGDIDIANTMVVGNTSNVSVIAGMYEKVAKERQKSMTSISLSEVSERSKLLIGRPITEGFSDLVEAEVLLVTGLSFDCLGSLDPWLPHALSEVAWILEQRIEAGKASILIGTSTDLRFCDIENVHVFYQFLSKAKWIDVSCVIEN